MAKACLSCGTINASNARFCSRCGKALSSKGPASPSRAKAGRGTGKFVYCEECREQRLVKGPFKRYFENPPPLDQDEEEWVYETLVCGHDHKLRSTGKTRPVKDLRY